MKKNFIRIKNHFFALIFVFLLVFMALPYFFCSNFFHKNLLIAHAKEETITYAKVAPNCILFRSPTLVENIDNVIFIIPETYFVSIIETVSESAYKVQYGNYIGYISILTVEIATFTPNEKTLEGVTLDIKENSGTQIWSKPSSTSSILTTIQAGTQNISYIAKVYGAIPSGGKSNVWYYVSYTPEFSSTSVYEGYVYSENVTNLKEIPQNTEYNPETLNEKDQNDFSLYISSPIKALIVAIIAIPIIVFFLIIIYKITKLIREKSSKMRQSNESSSGYHDNMFANNYGGRNYAKGNYNPSDSYDKNFSNQNYASDYQNSNNFNDDGRYQNYNNANFNGYNPNQNLRQEIQNMKKKSYVRKMNNHASNYFNDYPDFPAYDSDDDLL